MPLSYSGPFAEPNATWQLTCDRPSRVVSLAHARLFREAADDFSAVEQRPERRSAGRLITRQPATHRFHLQRLVNGHASTIVVMDVRLLGQAPQQKTPDQQAEAICGFFEFLLYQDDHQQVPWPKTWEYCNPGGLAYLFWFSALVSRYCELWAP
ncbi:MAG: hypothetical protein F6K00_19515 [Leptolyngbya sp. SIOISBB]|nr:hypothetical protein [Leptolyngbya sp. SIOISBB]